MTEPHVAAAATCLLGESPLWDAGEGALHWVDVRNPAVHSLDPATGARRSRRVQTEIGCIGLAGGRRLVAGTRMGFALIDLDGDGFEQLADPEGSGRLNRVRMNDGRVDRRGRLWCGSMQDPVFAEVGWLYRLDPDGSVHRVEGPLTVPNAICWSPDDRVMYFADSLRRVVWACDFDLEAGAVANRRTFVEIDEADGLPDGAVVDGEGHLWVALMRGGAVRRYDPDGGLEREIRFPVSQTTCPAFGGPDLTTLYVTTGSARFGPEDFAREPLAGSLFAVETEVRGVPEPLFGG